MDLSTVAQFALQAGGVVLGMYGAARLLRWYMARGRSETEAREALGIGVLLLVGAVFLVAGVVGLTARADKGLGWLMLFVGLGFAAGGLWMARLNRT